MIRWIVRSSLKFRFLVVALAAVMMLFGIGQLNSLPVDVFPEFAQPRVEVQTASLGLTSSEVEELVTVPIEQVLTGIPGLEVVRSRSVPQLSSIELIFERGTDLLLARQLVQERLTSVTPTLPSWSTPPDIMQPLSATSRVMKIGLSSERLSMIELSVLARYTIRTRLLRVPGVANVAIWGQRNEQRQVQVLPDRLAQYGISLDTVHRVTADALDAGLLRYSTGSFIGTGGFIDTPNQRLGIRHVLPIASSVDLANVTVGEKPDGTPLLLSDIAVVTTDHQPLIGDAVINGGPGLMLIVEKLPWGNTLEVTEGVDAALAELAPGLSDVEIDPTIFRPATFIERAIDNLTESLLIGALLVVAVLWLFLFSWRSALISVVTIPISLVAAGLVLNARGVTINTMVLAGFVIALGAVVDDAIVDTENIVRRLREHWAQGGGTSTARVILEASVEVRGAIVFASLIEAFALLPIFFLEGLTGAFFRPLAISYALAVLVSMLVALILTPAMSMILLSKSSLRRGEPPLVRWLRRGYHRILAPIVATPRPAYAAVGALVLAGVLITPQLGQSLLPSFKENDFLMHWVTKPDTSHPEMIRITEAANDELSEIPGVQNFGAHIGQALLGDEVVGIHFGENWISIDPDANYDGTVAAVQEVVDGYPGLRRDVQTYLKERIREVLTGAGDTIVVRIYGDDLEILRSEAEEVKELIASIEGVVDEQVELQEDVPQVEIEVDLDAASPLGIKPGDVRRAVSTLVAGLEVGDTYRNGKAYDVNVWSVPDARNSVTDISSLLIDTPDGGHVTVGDIARVSVEPTPNMIVRENASRSIDIGMNVSGRDLGSVARDIEEQLRTIEFPLEYHAEVLGEYAERRAADRRLLLFGSVAALGIFLLLVKSFGSWRLAVLSFFTLPMALVGGVLAAYLGGGVISLGSLVGLFTILGIVARNGIMQISHFQHLEREEGEPFGVGLVLRGSSERLIPILMTALTTGLALVPLVIAGNIPGQEIEHPMAQVILGGLVTSTLLNLFVVPSLYLRFAGRPRGQNSDSGPVRSENGLVG